MLCGIVIIIPVVAVYVSKQGIRWPVSRDHIAGLSFELIKVLCFFKLTAGQALTFQLDCGLKPG